jgi:hypothetical protein
MRKMMEHPIHTQTSFQIKADFRVKSALTPKLRDAVLELKAAARRQKHHYKLKKKRINKNVGKGHKRNKNAELCVS